MTLVKWVPNRTSINMISDFENIINNVFNSTSAESWSPSFSVTEDSNCYKIYADTPGVAKKDLLVAIEDGIVRIEGERKAVKQNESSFSKTARYGKFKRSFSIPDDGNADKVTAKLNDGVLTLSIPKSEKVTNLKKISIR